ncbi:MAG: DUF262 domain-containing protein [Alphaproteobacteria bacterium]|jgi:hypothetical protein|nr:DUF262 domain-containing protein [Alphaproteobacteria bacterium]
MKIYSILDRIDIGSMSLPAFQRGYVWSGAQVRKFMYSLYLRRPVGSLLVWLTEIDDAAVRGSGEPAPGTANLILDGQQRVTTLYGIIRGQAPKFFEGNAKAFENLHFNLRHQKNENPFAFFSQLRMSDDPMWVNVTELMREGLGPVMNKLKVMPEFNNEFSTFFNRLNAVYGIKDIDLYVEELTGEDKTVDVVVDIFNWINSGGTKLSKGDLALAKVCADWPDARNSMDKRLKKWDRAGFRFRYELLLRVITTITTDSSDFDALANGDTESFKRGVDKAEKYVDLLLDLIANRLGLDHDRVVGSKYSFPLMARFLDERGGDFQNKLERDKILYWYLHSIIWGRYAGATETVLNRDLAAIRKSPNAIENLFGELRRSRADLQVRPHDLVGEGKGARLYPLMYMLNHLRPSLNWSTGKKLSEYRPGARDRLKVHYVFPKKSLYANNYKRAQANDLANFVFLPPESVEAFAGKDPSIYLNDLYNLDPELLKSHDLPLNNETWSYDNYSVFLTERREILAATANRILEELLSGNLPESEINVSVVDRDAGQVSDGITDLEEDRQLMDCMVAISGMGLAEGELEYELTDEITGEWVATLDLAWPQGLQEGLGQPIALLINENEEAKYAANKVGFRVFTKRQELMDYVEKTILNN